MLARTFTKILDESIVPAVIIIAGKILGLTLANIVNNLPYTIMTGGSILPWTVVYNSTSEGNIANTFSNLVMYLVVFSGFLVVLIRAHYLHDTHLPPKLAGRLLKLRLFHFVTTTFEIYHQALVWLSFLWITTLVLFFYTLGGGSITITMIGFLLSFIATYLYMKDVDVEIETEKMLRETH